MTWLELCTLVTCVVLFLSLRDLTQSSAISRWWLLGSVVSAGVAEACFGLRQAAEVNGPATAVGTYLNRNHFAGFLEMALPFVVAASFQLGKSGSRWKGWRLTGSFLLGCSAAVVLAAIFFTYSRTGAACALVALLLSFSLSVWPWIREARPRRWILALACAGLFASVVFFAPRRLRDRVEHASAFDQESTSLRLAFWRDCRPLVSDYLLTGAGLGSFESVYPMYQRSGTAYRVEYAHNDYLQALIELGLPLFLLVLSVLVWILVELASRSIARSSANYDLCGIAAFSAIVAISIHSLADFNLRIPANAMTIAWVLALGMSGQRNSTSAAESA